MVKIRKMAYSSPRYEIHPDFLNHGDDESKRVFIEDTTQPDECYLFSVTGNQKKRLCDHTLPKEKYIKWLLEQKMTGDLICPKCNQIKRFVKEENQQVIDRLTVQASAPKGLTETSRYCDLFYEHVYHTLGFLLAVLRQDLSSSETLQGYLKNPEVSGAVEKLTDNIGLWHKKIEKEKNENVAMKWGPDMKYMHTGIFYDHTMAAAKYIVAVYQGNKSVEDESIKTLTENAELVANFWSKDMGYERSGIAFHWGEHLNCTIGYTEKYASEKTRFNVTWDGDFQDALDIFTELPLARKCLMFGAKFGMYLDREVGSPPMWWWPSL